MRSLLVSAGALAVTILASLAATAEAEVNLRLPFMALQVGQPAPVVQPVIPGNPLPVPVEPVPTLPPPTVMPAPVPAPSPAPVPALMPVPTLAQFAAVFKPLPGNYEVMLRHPVTGCPVKVCFSLPPGCPRKVRVLRRHLAFVYPHHTVAITFRHNGSVQVKN